MIDIYNDIVRVKAEELLKRAELPEDKAKAEIRKNIFLQELSRRGYKYGDNGEVIILNELGIEVTDPHGYNLSIDEAIKNTFDKYFDISSLPATAEECITRLKDPKITPEERRVITERWNKLKT